MRPEEAAPVFLSKNLRASNLTSVRTLPPLCYGSGKVTLDAAIIGGGPAGAAAAISLRRLMPAAALAIFDSGTGKRWRPGEVLSPGAASLLQSLGCWPEFLAGGFIESFGTRAAWGSAEAHENEFLFGTRGDGWRLDRARFDAMMLERARASGVLVHRGAALTESGVDGAGWRLRFRGVAECRARFVIDASGRAAAFAVQRGARHLPDDRLAGVFVLFETALPEDGDPLIEAAETGWWYSAGVPGSRAVAAFMTDTDLIRESQLHRPCRWNDILAGTMYTRARLRNAIPEGPPAVFAAQSHRLSRMGGEGWVAAGDAAMTFDPLSSQGILKALRSGKLASFVAADFLMKGVASQDRLETLAEAEYSGYRQIKQKYYHAEQRWPDALFWRRRR